MSVREKLEYIADMSSSEQVVLVTTEELAETIQALSKVGRALRGDITLRKEYSSIIEELYEEIADAYITLFQVERKFKLSKKRLDDIIEYKVIRTCRKLTQKY